MAIFTGAGVAIITPFHEDGSVNYEKFAEHIEAQIAGGTDAIIVCGTTGEASTLTHEEHLEVIRFCVEKTAGRVRGDHQYLIRMGKDWILRYDQVRKGSRKGTDRRKKRTAPAKARKKQRTIQTIKAANSNKNLPGAERAQACAFLRRGRKARFAAAVKRVPARAAI